MNVKRKAAADVDSTVQLVVLLAGFLVFAVVIGVAFPEAFDKAKLFLQSILEWAMRMLGMTVRGCDDTSVSSILALKAALNCEAYIHANERCVELIDPCAKTSPYGSCVYPRFEYGDLDVFTGATNTDHSFSTITRTDKTLDSLPKEIKRVNFMVKKRGLLEDQWKLEKFEVYNIDKNNVKHKIIDETPDRWLKSGTPAESYTPWYGSVNYGDVKVEDRTTKYEVQVKTKDEGITAGTGTDDQIYFCYSTLDKTNTEGSPNYVDCTKGMDRWGGPKVACTDTGNQYGKCEVKDFKIEQREKSILASLQPDCVVYYEAFPSGEEQFWKPNIHEYDYAYIFFGGVMSAAFSGAAGEIASKTRNYVLISGKNSGNSILKSVSRFTNKILGKSTFVTADESIVQQGTHALIENMRRETSEQVITRFHAMPNPGDEYLKVTPDLIDDIKGSNTRTAYKYWTEIGGGEMTDDQVEALARRLPDDFEREFQAAGITDDEVKLAVKKAMIGDVADELEFQELEEFYHLVKANEYASIYKASSRLGKWGFEVKYALVTMNMFEDITKNLPRTFASKRAYYLAVNQRTYEMMKYMQSKSTVDSLLKHASVGLGFCMDNTVCRMRLVEFASDDLATAAFNESVYKMIGDRLPLVDEDSAETWGKCLTAVPGKRGMMACGLGAMIGLEVMDKYSATQKFLPVGINSLGYYRPYDATPKTVDLAGETNYYYIQLDKENLQDIRFNLASPCQGTIEIKHERCECNTGDSVGSGANNPNYFLDTHIEGENDGVFESKPPKDNPEGDKKIDLYPEIYSYRLSGNTDDCVLNISKIFLDKDICNGENSGVCSKFEILYNNIDAPILMSDMVCCVPPFPSAKLFVPKELCDAFSDGLVYARLADYPGIDYCEGGVYNIRSNDECGTPEQWASLRALDSDDNPIPASIGAYIDKNYNWPGFWTGYEEDTFYTQYPMVFTGTDKKIVPDTYGIPDPADNKLKFYSGSPLDTVWSSLFPIRSASDLYKKGTDTKTGKPIFDSIPTAFYQAYIADLNRKDTNADNDNDIPILYMDSDATGVKECLSLDEAKQYWNHASDTKEVECLKVSVKPPNNDWESVKENYCYHDISNEEFWMQSANTVAWMGLEWAVTAYVGVQTLGTGAAATKVVTGFVSGMTSEYLSQKISNDYQQKWPGHSN